MNYRDMEDQMDGILKKYVCPMCFKQGLCINLSCCYDNECCGIDDSVHCSHGCEKGSYLLEGRWQGDDLEDFEEAIKDRFDLKADNE